MSIPANPNKDFAVIRRDSANRLFELVEEVNALKAEARGVLISRLTHAFKVAMESRMDWEDRAKKSIEEAYQKPFQTDTPALAFSEMCREVREVLPDIPSAFISRQVLHFLRNTPEWMEKIRQRRLERIKDEDLFNNQFLDGVVSQSPNYGASGASLPIFEDSGRAFTPAFNHWRELRCMERSQTAGLRAHPPCLG